MAGLYIVVDEDTSTAPTCPANPTNPTDPDDSYTYPDIPKTGDSSNIVLYLMLMAISDILLLLLLLKR